MEATSRLRAGQLPPTVSFWCDVLGFGVSGSDNPGGDPMRWCELRRDGAVVEFYVDGQPMPDDLGDAVAVCLRPVDVDGNLDRARSAGATVVWGPEDFEYGFREAAVRDPNGYLVILSAPI